MSLATAFRAIPRTVWRTFGALRSQGMSSFAPVLVLLLLLAALLWAINAVAPLAPFVYSLF